MKKNKKLVEKTVLNTFQEEIPSIYFSDKNKSEYETTKPELFVLKSGREFKKRV